MSAQGECLIADCRRWTPPHPELSRTYFEREARRGCRVIFLWHVSKRWPERPADPDMPDRYIEGIEFSSPDHAQHFDVVDHMTGGEMFSTWQEAEVWLFSPRADTGGKEGP